MTEDLDTATAVRTYLGNQQRTDAAVNLQAVAGTSGDLEAELRAASARTGVPISSARAMPDVVKRRAEAADLQDTLQRFPSTMGFLANESAARIAHDDVPVLTQIESTIGSIASYVMGADGRGGLAGDIGAGVFRASRGAAGVFQAAAETAAPLFEPTGVYRGAANPATDAAAWFARQGATAEQRAKALAGTPNGIIAGGVSSGVQSFIGNALMLPFGMLPGGQAAALAGMAGGAGGTSYQNAREKGVPVAGAAIYGASDAAIEWATEKIPVGRLFGDLHAGKPTFSTLWRQVAAEVPGEQVATVLQDLNEWAVLNKDKPFSEYLKERPAAAAQTLIATLIGAGGNVAVVKAVQDTLDRTQGVDRRAEHVAAIMTAAAQSKTRERDPATFADAVDKMVADTGAPAEVYVDARAFAEALNQSGVTPEQAAAALPSIARQFAEAQAAGGDLVIPLGELAAGVAGSPIEQALMQHIRLTPDALSQAEGATARSVLGDSVQRAADVAAETDRQADYTAVRDQVLAQLNAAGRFTSDVNNAYADMMAGFFAATAQRLGVTAQELYQQRGPVIQAEGVTGPALDQRLAPSPVLNAPRAPTADEMRRFGRVEDVPLAQAFSTQGSRQWDRFDAGDHPPPVVEGFGDMPVAVKLRSGQYLVVDGHHRSERALGRGDVSARMHVIDAAAFDPANAGRAPVKDDTDPDALLRDLLAQGARGQYTPSTRTITLLAKADLSTFLHESGHYFLDQLTDLAAQPDAPAALQADMQKLLDWFGVADLATWRAMTLDQQREHHEKFARGFEAYLFEGTAPNTSLRAVFQRFRAWLTSVYRTVRALAVDLNPEVRGVMDRLLATEDEIAAAEAARGMVPAFASAKEAGMTPEEFAAYQALGAEATAAAVDTMQRRSMRDMQWLTNARNRALKALQKTARLRRKEVEAEVTREVDALPVEQARRLVKERQKAAAAASKEHRSERRAWVERYDAERARVAAEVQDAPGLTTNAERKDEVVRQMLVWEARNPAPAPQVPVAELDVIAEATGFTSGDHLSKALAEAPARADLIEGLADQRMLERYGELSDQAAIERAANEAVHNEARAKFVATEAAALQAAVEPTRQRGSPRVLLAAARDFAARAIGAKQVKDVRPAQYTAAEARAAREAERAKDVVDKATAKRNQLLNHELARTASAALDDIESGVRYLRKFDREGVRKALDVDYVDQIDALLERYDLRAGTTLADIARRQSLAAWVEKQNEMGVEPDIPQQLLDGLDRRSYKELTVDEFRGLVDTVKQIEHLGRLKNKLLTAKAQREFDAVKDEIVASIEANSRGRSADTRTPNTLPGEALVRLKRFWAAHIKAATWARVMDGGKDGGPLWEYLIRGANEAGDRETVMREQATRDLAALVAPLLKDGQPMGGKGRYFESIGKSLNREARLAIALNWGNEGNRQRLLGGEGWSSEQVMPVLRSITPAEWAFVQSVWDHFESYRPEIAAKERRVYGREPQWVEPAPFELQTDAGIAVLRGGYYPIKYDPRASERAEAHNEAEEAKNLMRAAYTSATTRRSFTKARAEEVSGRPLLYSLDGIYNGVQEVIHDLTWHEWLIDANRLVRNRSISSAMRNTYGPEAHQQFKDWIRDVAQGEKPAQGAGEAALSWVRQGVSVAGLGFNVMSAAMQPLGLTQSIVRIGPTWVGRGLVKSIGAPFDTARRISEMSDFMRTRFLTQTRELNEVRNQVKGQGKARRALDAGAYALMIYAQRTVDTPTWWGAYEKATAEGNDQQRAVALADQAVIDAQGGGQTKDLSGIERGGPALKLFTTFYSFFNTALNLGVARTMTEDSKLKLAADYLLLFTVPALLGGVLKDALTPGDSGDDPEKLARKLIAAQLSYLFGLVFGVREIGGFTSNIIAGEAFGTDYTGPAGLRMFGDLAKLMQQVKQGELDDGLRKAIVNLAGDLLRLPSAQINRSITGAQALAEGKTDNPAALVAGYQEPR